MFKIDRSLKGNTSDIKSTILNYDIVDLPSWDASSVSRHRPTNFRLINWNSSYCNFFETTSVTRNRITFTNLVEFHGIQFDRLRISGWNLNADFLAVISPQQPSLRFVNVLPKKKQRVDNPSKFLSLRRNIYLWNCCACVHRLFQGTLSRTVTYEPGNYGKLLLFDRSKSVYFIDKLWLLTFPLGDTKDFPTGE